MISPIYGYNAYTPVLRYQNFTGMEQPKLNVKPGEEEHKKASAKLALWSLAVLAVPLAAYLLTRGKGSKAAEKMAQQASTAATGAAKAETAVKKFSEMSVAELKTALDSSASVGDNMSIMKTIFEKSKGKDAIEAGENYIKYLDDIKNGKVKLNDKDFFERGLSSNDFSYIEIEKCDIYSNMSHIYKSEKNYPKALEMAQKAGELRPGNKSTIGEISKLHALNGNPDEGIRVAKQALEKIKDKAFGDEQVFLFDAIADCVKAKGNEDLYKSITLLKKGSYDFDKLTSDEMKYLTDKGINPKSICGCKPMHLKGSNRTDFEPDGHGREQTGLLAKWVLAQV